MINAYGMHGHGKAAIDLFNKMKKNLTPDHVTFLSVLYSCSHSGLFDEGRRLSRSGNMNINWNHGQSTMLVWLISLVGQIA